MQPSFQRFRVVWLAGIVIVVVLAWTAAAKIAFIPARPDPVFNGIRLSEVLSNELAVVDRTIYWLDSPSGPDPWFLVFSNGPPRQQEFIRALCGMGREAWPVLLSELETPSPEKHRQRAAERAMAELILPPDVRSDLGDPNWPGIGAFPYPFRRRMALDLAGVLLAHPKDRNLSAAVCGLLERSGISGQAAIPALELASRAGMEGATNALARFTGRRTDPPARVAQRFRAFITGNWSRTGGSQSTSTPNYDGYGAFLPAGDFAVDSSGHAPEIKWSFVERRGERDVYRFTLRFPANSAVSAITNKEVEFNGGSVVVFQDGPLTVVPDPPDLGQNRFGS